MIFFEEREAFEAWLEENGETEDEVWVRMAKKHTGIPSLDWAGAVEAALCFDWIDSQSRRLDEYTLRGLLVVSGFDVRVGGPVVVRTSSPRAGVP